MVWPRTDDDHKDGVLLHVCFDSKGNGSRFVLSFFEADTDWTELNQEMRFQFVIKRFYLAYISRIYVYIKSCEDFSNYFTSAESIFMKTQKVTVTMQHGPEKSNYVKT